MIFSINKNVLLSSLQIIQRGLPTKSPLPILYTIKFEVNQDHILLTSNNSDIAIQLIIETEIHITQPGKAAISGKVLIDIIKKLDSQSVSFAVIDDSLIAIKGGKSEFKLKLYDVLEYPDVDFLKTTEPILIDSELLKLIISQTSYATAQDERKPILTGTNFSYKNSLLSLVATDGYRLSKRTTKIKSSHDFNFVIPSKGLMELEKIFDIVSDNIELYINPNKVLFKFNNILFQTRLLEGKFPDITNIIPYQHSIVIPFNRADLISAVERVSLLSPRDRNETYNIIKMTLRDDHVVEITTTNQEIGEALEEVNPSGDVLGSGLNIAFSSKYLLDALKTFNSPDIKMKFTKNTEKFIIESDLEQGLIQLIVPVQIK